MRPGALSLREEERRVPDSRVLREVGAGTPGLWIPQRSPGLLGFGGEQS